MSNLFAADRAAKATPVPVWTQPRSAAPFMAWGEVHNDADEAPMEPEEEAIDVEAIQAAAMAQGFTAGIEAGRKEADKERQALQRLAIGLELLRPEPTQGLGAMIAATVDRLVREVMGEVEIDQDTLVARANAAAALIGEEARPTLLKLNPQDFARLKGVELPVTAEPDASLEPGNLRLETGSGCIEDGPAVRMDRLRGALDRIAGTR